MRTTIEVDERLLREAFKITRLRTKKDLINLSLQELIRLKHIENIKERIGNYKLNLTLKELEALRKNG